MSVKLYVRDNTNGNVHEYGTNQHDALILQDDGSLHYRNLQNGCGTMYPDEGYTFCEADGNDPRTSGDYIHYGVEPYIDIGGNGKDHTCVTYEWISVKDRLPEVGERVLTLDKWGHIHDRMLYQFVDGFISFRPDGLKPGIDVTHWMQLPEPPEMEKTEE